jgi:hypothetical protein
MGFYRHDMGEMYSMRDLEISEVSVQVYSDAAWAELNWNFSAKRRKEGSSVSFRAWRPRFTARTTTVGVWFTFTIPLCPLKRRSEQNESVRFMLACDPIEPYNRIVSYIRHVENRR